MDSKQKQQTDINNDSYHGSDQPPAYNSNSNDQNLVYDPYGSTQGQSVHQLHNEAQGNNPGVQLKPGTYTQSTTAPISIECPNCKIRVLATIERRTSGRTFAAAGAIFIIFWPLSFVPFVSRHMKKRVHCCPICHYKLQK